MIALVPVAVAAILAVQGVEVTTNTATQTLTNKTLTSPTITTMLIDDGDAGLTVTSADQTNASPTATIPDIGDAADSFVMNDTAATLTNKTKNQNRGALSTTRRWKAFSSPPSAMIMARRPSGCSIQR